MGERNQLSKSLYRRVFGNNAPQNIEKATDKSKAILCLLLELGGCCETNLAFGSKLCTQSTPTKRTICKWTL